MSRQETYVEMRDRHLALSKEELFEEATSALSALAVLLGQEGALKQVDMILKMTNTLAEVVEVSMEYFLGRVAEIEVEVTKRKEKDEHFS